MESITRVLSFLFGIIRKSRKGYLTKNLIYTFHWLRSRCRLKLRHSLYYGLAANDFINEHVLWCGTPEIRRFHGLVRGVDLDNTE